MNHLRTKELLLYLGAYIRESKYEAFSGKSKEVYREILAILVARGWQLCGVVTKDVPELFLVDPDGPVFSKYTDTPIGINHYILWFGWSENYTDSLIRGPGLDTWMAITDDTLAGMPS